MNWVVGHGPLISTTTLGSGLAGGSVTSSGSGFGTVLSPPYPTKTSTLANTVPGVTLSSNLKQSVVLVPGQSTSISDVIDFQVLAQLDTGFTGTCTGVLQGSLKRYSTTSSDWISLGTPVAITTAPTPITIIGTSGSEEPTVWPAYRLQFDGISGTGVGSVSWAMNGVFPDLNVMQVALYSTEQEGGRQ